MAEPFLSEIRIMSFVFAPKGWALCNGQLLPINQNQALFSLLGTTFGGDGRVNFALPDLGGRTPIHVGSSHMLGERGGEQAHTLSLAELPTHTHSLMGSSNTGNTQDGAGNVLWRRARPHLYGPGESRPAASVDGYQRRRKPGPSEHATVRDTHVRDRTAGHFPVAELGRASMAQPYVGEIRMFAGNFAPAGWMFCEGQLLPISENETLFQLIGTTYGGDGESTFALPDLRGRIPIHQGNGFILAETGGAEEITLTVNQIPAHTHPFQASGNLSQDTSPAGKTVGQASAGVLLYIQDATDSNLSPQAITSVGGSQPHTNFQPYLCVSFIISLFGIFPSPT